MKEFRCYKQHDAMQCGISYLAKRCKEGVTTPYTPNIMSDNWFSPSNGSVGRLEQIR